MSKSSTEILRQLLRELRITSSDGKIKDTLFVKYILNQFNKYKVTDAQLCKKQNDMKFLADTYRCYLQSVRQYQELNSRYHGKGERSVKETADMVGFKLPQDRK